MVSHKQIRVIRVIRGLSLAALLLLAPRLAAAAVLNGASLHLLPQWQHVADAAAPPECPAPTAPSTVRPTLERARQWQRDHPRLLVLLGRAAWLEGDCAGARAAWERALTAGPDETAALWALLAGSDAVGGSAVDPARLAKYLYRAGDRARQAGLEEAAVGWYRRSLDLTPSRRAASALAAIYE